MLAEVISDVFKVFLCVFVCVCVFVCFNSIIKYFEHIEMLEESYNELCVPTTKI